MAAGDRRRWLGQGSKEFVCHAKRLTLCNERETLEDLNGQNEMIRLHFRKITVAKFLDMDKTRDKETK